MNNIMWSLHRVPTKIKETVQWTSFYSSWNKKYILQIGLEHGLFSHVVKIKRRLNKQSKRPKKITIQSLKSRVDHQYRNSGFLLNTIGFKQELRQYKSSLVFGYFNELPILRQGNKYYISCSNWKCQKFGNKYFSYPRTWDRICSRWQKYLLLW